MPLLTGRDDFKMSCSRYENENHKLDENVSYLIMLILYIFWLPWRELYYFQGKCVVLMKMYRTPLHVHIILGVRFDARDHIVYWEHWETSVLTCNYCMNSDSNLGTGRYRQTDKCSLNPLPHCFGNTKPPRSVQPILDVHVFFQHIWKL